MGLHSLAPPSDPSRNDMTVIVNENILKVNDMMICLKINKKVKTSSENNLIYYLLYFLHIKIDHLLCLFHIVPWPLSLWHVSCLTSFHCRPTSSFILISRSYAKKSQSLFLLLSGCAGVFPSLLFCLLNSPNSFLRLLNKYKLISSHHVLD